MNIKSVSAVENFFRFIVEDKGVNFHPDNDFSDYINLETKEPSFTPEEVIAYNKAMKDCFNVCQNAGVDIYDLGMKYLMLENAEKYKKYAM